MSIHNVINVVNLRTLFRLRNVCATGVIGVCSATRETRVSYALRCQFPITPVAQAN